MKSDFLIIKAKKDLKWLESKLIDDQIRLLDQEIALRKKMKEQLIEKVKHLLDEAQSLADEMLTIEYNSLVAANI